MTVTSRCREHPDADAPYVCARCRSPMCDNCAVHGADGAIVCRQCQRQVAVTSDAGTAPVPPPVTTRPLARGSTVLCCKNHPDVAAATRCAQCQAGICATCDFSFPGAIHLCPQCATNPKQALSPGRKSKTAWSIGLGGFSLGSCALLIVGSRMSTPDKDTIQALGCCFTVCFVLGIIGFVLGITSFNRRAHNPGYLWFGVILNALVILLFVSLTLLGLMRGAG